MAIDSEFINKLPDNTLLAEQKLIDAFYQTLDVYAMAEDKSKFYEDFIELYSFYEVFAEKRGLDVSFPRLGVNPANNMEIIISFFNNRQRLVSKKVEKYVSQTIIQNKKNKFKALLNEDAFYEFKTEELKDIKIKLHEVKNLIEIAQKLEESYKKRFYKRIDLIFKELTVETSSLDFLWGLAGEAGVISAKMGEKGKEISDKIKEILQITWQVQARNEKLDETAPLLNVSFKSRKEKKEEKKRL